MSAQLATTTPEPTTAPSPARRVAGVTLSSAALPAVWWTIGVVAVISAGVSFALPRFGILEQGAWLGITSIARWVAGFAGVMIGSALRHLVAHGITRRDGFDGLVAGALGLSVVAGAVVAVGAGVEWLAFARVDAVTTPVASLTGVGVTWLAATTQLVAYLVSGALIGVAFGTLPWTVAIPVIVPALVPAAVTEALWATALAPVDPQSGPFQALQRLVDLGPGTTTGALAVVVCVVTTAVGVAVLRRGVVRLHFPS